MIKIKYTRDELVTALISIDDTLIEKLKDNQSLDKLFDNRFGYSLELLNDKKFLNKKVAERNGITVTQLINSPNMKDLIEEFSEHNYSLIVECFKDIGLTDAQAWGILAASRNLID